MSSGEVVVLIHGFTVDRRMWDDQFDLLAKFYQVIRNDQAEDLKELLESLKVDCAHIVGLSMGGQIATIFGIKYPERF